MSSYKQYIAGVLLTTMLVASASSVHANATEYNNKLTQNAIEKITGTKTIVKNTTESNDFVVKTDGFHAVVKIPQKASNPILINSAYDNNNNFGMLLPEQADDSNVNKSENGTVVYTTNNRSASFGAQAVQEKGMEGVRALITINNSAAPKEYTFKFNLKEGTKLVTDTEYLGKEFSTGEVFIVNNKNIITGIVDKPWAYDANCKKVPTHYKIQDGNKLTQVIEFTNNTAFPVIADPSAWQITKCVGSITWAIGSGVFSVAKIFKIKKYVAALGGVKEAAAALMGVSTTGVEKGTAFGSALMQLGSAVLGITAIKENCNL